MRTVNSVQCASYREACCELGLLADDGEWQRCIDDVFKSTFEPLSVVFATILTFCDP